MLHSLAVIVARLPLLALLVTAAACSPTTTSAPQRAPQSPIDVPSWAQTCPSTGESQTLHERPAPMTPRHTVQLSNPAQVDPLQQFLRLRGRKRIESLSLQRAPVDQTLRMLADMGRFNLVFVDDTADRRVTLELRDVSLADAFQAVLASAGLEGRVMGDNIVTVDDKGP